MKFTAAAAACLSLLAQTVSSESAAPGVPLSKITLPSTFKPPQVFKNANLVHLISLEKNYARETVNLVIENISPEPQDEYFVPFTSSRVEHVGGFEVKDKKDEGVVGFAIDSVEFDPSR